MWQRYSQRNLSCNFERTCVNVQMWLWLMIAFWLVLFSALAICNLSIIYNDL